MASPSSAAAGPPAREELLLTVKSPAGKTAEVRVDRSPFRIGRLQECDLVLRDSRISRAHAQILFEDGVYFIEDRDSRHGLQVNGGKTRRIRLRAGDRIRFGVEDSFEITVGRERGVSAPLLKKVASMPQAPDRTGNLGRLSAVLDVARALESSGTVDDVLEAAVDAALTVTGADRAFLLLKGAGEELAIRAARDKQGAPLDPSELRVPRSSIADALHKRRDPLTMPADRSLDETADPARPNAAPEPRSVLYVPLVKIRIGQEQETSLLSTKDDTLGALYLDKRGPDANLAEGNREILQSLAIEISTVLENARLLEVQRDKHRLEQELRFARDIQQALLPAALPAEGRLTAAGHSEACFQVGGDYYDVVQISPDRWGAVLADVSGKGVAAALLASLLQGAFFAGADADSSLSEVIGRINRYICARSRHARFATVFAVTVDADGLAKWVSAGHCPTLLVRKDGAIQWLKPKSFPLGLFADAEFEESELLLSAGDKLVIYSDGVSEANNRSHAQFGEERLRRAAGENAAAGPQQLFEALLKEIQEFTQGAQQNDDLTLLVLGYRG